jgi:DEAD/DEAH box helicase domain-containing protein
MPEIPLFDPSALPGEVTLDQVVPAQQAVFAPLPEDLAPELASALFDRGIDRLFSHQAEAYEAARARRHVVVVTPTASGKTLCYNLPILQRLLERPDSRALYLFPTKALAQDQLTELAGLARGLDRKSVV